MAGVSRNLSNVSLYCDETPCSLPMHGSETEFKKCRVGGLLQPQQPENQSVRDNIPDLYTDGKWKVAIKGNNNNVKRLWVTHRLVELDLGL